ncbi:uncharacterized protein LOC109826366 [Asparagus officinalis]|uniref:uncharacterized protein LOC109826366 n=1 Tax=Asparagus officinalis TaxID=4686 RepID=UPI00098E3CDA|nr:uncharacterized protein LOC109826366 [Asparagus officinalis]
MAFHVCHISCLRAKPIDKCRNHPASLRAASSTINADFKSRKPGFSISSYSQRKASSPSPLKCSSSDRSRIDLPGSDSLVELPLLPHPLVLFPGVTLPLQVFEFRYRIMMHTILQSDLRFGVIYSDKLNGAAGVGCAAEIVKHERLVDDRFFIFCKGQERFRVISLVQTKPYTVAKVRFLEDRPSSSEQQDLESIALEVEICMKDVIRLSNKLNGTFEEKYEDIRRNLFPTPFSFFVGSTFEGAPREQQALLELEDTGLRLKRERETLRNTLNYLVAASAVRDAFQYSSSNEN